MFTRRFFLKGLSAAAAMLPFTAATGAAAATAAAPVFSDTRLMMGTFVTVSISGTTDTHAADAAGRAFERMSALESLLTRHRASSPLGQLNAAGSLGDVPPELLAVLEASARMHRVTAKLFQPLFYAACFLSCHVSLRISCLTSSRFWGVLSATPSL